jgi:hypothetical protein
VVGVTYRARGAKGKTAHIGWVPVSDVQQFRKGKGGALELVPKKDVNWDMLTEEQQAEELRAREAKLRPALVYESGRQTAKSDLEGLSVVASAIAPSASPTAVLGKMAGNATDKVVSGISLSTVGQVGSMRGTRVKAAATVRRLYEARAQNMLRERQAKQQKLDHDERQFAQAAVGLVKRSREVQQQFELEIAKRDEELRLLRAQLREMGTNPSHGARVKLESAIEVRKDSDDDSCEYEDVRCDAFCEDREGCTEVDTDGCVPKSERRRTHDPKITLEAQKLFTINRGVCWGDVDDEESVDGRDIAVAERMRLKLKAASAIAARQLTQEEFGMIANLYKTAQGDNGFGGAVDRVARLHKASLKEAGIELPPMVTLEGATCSSEAKPKASGKELAPAAPALKQKPTESGPASTQKVTTNGATQLKPAIPLQEGGQPKKESTKESKAKRTNNGAPTKDPELAMMNRMQKEIDRQGEQIKAMTAQLSKSSEPSGSAPSKSAKKRAKTKAKEAEAKAEATAVASKTIEPST